MKKYNLLPLFFVSILLSSLALAGTYNFYFYDNDDNKNKKEETPPSTPEKTQNPSTDNANLDPDKISQLADEVAKKLKNDSISTNSNSFFSKDTYFSIGWGEDYASNAISGVIVRAKFFPLIAFEGMVPIVEQEFEKYKRATAMAELHLTQNICANLIGGAFFMEDIKENPYVGVGLKLRLWNSIDLAASANAKTKNIRTYGKNFLDWRYGKAFYTAGISYVF